MGEVIEICKRRQRRYRNGAFDRERLPPVCSPSAKVEVQIVALVPGSRGGSEKEKGRNLGASHKNLRA